MGKVIYLKREALDIQSLFLIHVLVANKLTIKMKKTKARQTCGENVSCFCLLCWCCCCWCFCSFPSSELSVDELSLDRHLDKRREATCFCFFLNIRPTWVWPAEKDVRRGRRVFTPAAISKQNPMLQKKKKKTVLYALFYRQRRIFDIIKLWKNICPIVELRQIKIICFLKGCQPRVMDLKFIDYQFTLSYN